MALARLLASKANYYIYIQRSQAGCAVINGMNIGSNALLCRLFSSSTNSNANGANKEVAVDRHSNSGGERKKSRWTSLLPRRLQRRRNEARGEYTPSLFDLIRTPSLGNSLLEASRNINRLLDDINDNLNLSPSQLIGRMKEKDDSYKLRFEVPGLSKDDIKITVDNGILSITGEHKDEEEDYHHHHHHHNVDVDVESSDDEFGTVASSRHSYGYYYNTSLVLPEDIKEDGIKAELINGVLTVVVPKDIDKKARQAKEIKIHTS